MHKRTTTNDTSNQMACQPWNSPVEEADTGTLWTKKPEGAELGRIHKPENKLIGEEITDSYLLHENPI